MTKSDKRTHPSLPGPPRDYDVGYGKPPAHSRFQKGISGNPKGRPRDAKNKRPALNEERLKNIVLDEACRTISVRDGAKDVKLPMVQAIVRAFAVNAAKGQSRAQRFFLEMLGHTEQSNRALHDEWLQTAMAYKTDWERELDRRKRHGIIADDSVPHPDDIVINLQHGTTHVIGPMTPEEQ